MAVDLISQIARPMDAGMMTTAEADRMNAIRRQNDAYAVMKQEMDKVGGDYANMNPEQLQAKLSGLHDTLNALNQELSNTEMQAEQAEQVKQGRKDRVLGVLDDVRQGFGSLFNSGANQMPAVDQWGSGDQGPVNPPRTGSLFQGNPEQRLRVDPTAPTIDPMEGLYDGGVNLFGRKSQGPTGPGRF